MARVDRRRLPRGQGHRRRAHGLVFHQYRLAGQPDHGVLPGGDGARAHDLARRKRGSTGDDLVLIAPNDPGAMNRYAAECIERGFRTSTIRRCSCRGWSVTTWRRAAAGARILAGNDYEFGMMAEKLGMTEAELRRTGADHRDDAGRGRRLDHRRRRGISRSPPPSPRRSLIRPGPATRSGRASCWVSSENCPGRWSAGWPR